MVREVCINNLFTSTPFELFNPLLNFPHMVNIRNFPELGGTEVGGSVLTGPRTVFIVDKDVPNKVSS